MAVTKILIANRGEIACRIIRTCREMGIPTVAVYSDVERSAMHVRLAEESFPVGPGPSRKSYMDVARLIEAGQKCGADAVHPGYGFLSEDPSAARRFIEAGFTWLGAAPEVLERLKDKTAARDIARAAGIPVLPGIHQSQSDEDLVAVAEQLGYPLIVKPVLGRYGRGIHVVKEAAELMPAVVRSKGDAMYYDLDDRVYLEKWLPRVRQIEVPIIGDAHGNHVYLWERECSIQRRYQAVAAEAPAPFVTPELRKALGEAALRIARAVHFVGAGAVEFLVDEDLNYYFLEVEARLSMDHAVTEWITGQDLVKWQILIGRKEKLPLNQEQIPFAGWAVECRIYAEDSDKDFAPSFGKLSYLRRPTGRNIRDDAGVYQGWNMSSYYEPLLSKVSTWGPTRLEAIQRMRAALMEYRVGGVRNNIDFMKALIDHEPFRRGDLHTHFLDEPFWKHREVGPNLKFAVAAALYEELEMEERRAQQHMPRPDAELRASAWKHWGKFSHRL